MEYSESTSQPVFTLLVWHAGFEWVCLDFDIDFKFPWLNCPLWTIENGQRYFGIDAMFWLQPRHRVWIV